MSLQIVKTLGTALKKLLEVELRSIAGRVNLIGGISIILLVLGLFLEDIGVRLVNMILVLFDKAPLPTVGSPYILLSIVVVVLYFYYCVNVVRKY
jgi:hypothetical protein